MLNKRGCGILLHPTSLPGPGGIGSLGGDALRFIDLERIVSEGDLSPASRNGRYPLAGNRDAAAGVPLLRANKVKVF